MYIIFPFCQNEERKTENILLVPVSAFRLIVRFASFFSRKTEKEEKKRKSDDKVNWLIRFHFPLSSNRTTQKQIKKTFSVYRKNGNKIKRFPSSLLPFSAFAFRNTESTESGKRKIGNGKRFRLCFRFCDLFLNSRTENAKQKMFSFLFPCFDFRFSVPCQIFFLQKNGKKKEKRKESVTDCFQVPFPMFI